MPQARASNRWEHKSYKWAYVREYRGVCYTIIHGRRANTGLMWCKESKVDALKILDARVRQHLDSQYSGIKKEETDNVSVRTCGQLFAQFAEAKFESMPEHDRDRYYDAFSRLVPEHLLLSDHLVIRRIINKSIPTLTSKHTGKALSSNTSHVLIARVMTIFAFGQKEGYIKVNPVTSNMIPSRELKEVKPYSEDLILDFINALYPIQQRYIEFLYLTAARAEEAANLRWQDVRKDAIVLHGKRTKGREQYRLLPFAAIDGLKSLIERSKPLEGTPAPTSKVFGDSSYKVVSGRLRRLFPEKFYGLHAIRKARIDHWHKVDMWPESLITALAGHDVDVSKQHYRTNYSVDDLVRLVGASSSKKEQT